MPTSDGRDPFAPPPAPIDVEFIDAAPASAPAPPRAFRCLCPPCGAPVAVGEGHCPTCVAVCLPALAEAHRRMRDGTLATPAAHPQRPAPPWYRPHVEGLTAADARAAVRLVADVVKLFGGNRRSRGA